MSGVRSRFLHVANGTATTDTIQAAGIPGRCSIWADPLHDGPVPADLNDDELVAVRRRHLSGQDGKPPTWIREHVPTLLKAFPRMHDGERAE